MGKNPNFHFRDPDFSSMGVSDSRFIGICNPTDMEFSSPDKVNYNNYPINNSIGFNTYYIPNGNMDVTGRCLYLPQPQINSTAYERWLEWEGHGSVLGYIEYRPNDSKFQGRWVLPKSFYKADSIYRHLLTSGNGMKINDVANTAERFQYVIGRIDYDGESEEWVKGYSYVKPRTNVTIVSGEQFGVVKYPTQCNVVFKYPYYTTGQKNQYQTWVTGSNGVPTHFLCELYDTTSNQLKKSLEIKVTDSNPETTYTFSFDTADLEPDHNHKLRITPYVKYNNTIYKYSNVYKEINNYVKFSPKPTGRLTINRPNNLPSDNVVRDESSINLTFSYDNNKTSNGVATKFGIYCVNQDDSFDKVFIGDVTNPTSYRDYSNITYSKNVDITLLDINKVYVVEIAPIYVTKTGGEVYGNFTTSNFTVQRNPSPLNKIFNLVYLKDTEYLSSYPDRFGGNVLTIKWEYDDSNPSKNGIVNCYKIELFGTDYLGVIYSTTKSFNIGMAGLPFGVPISMTITPEYKYNNSYYTGSGTSVTFVDYVTRDAGIRQVGFVSPETSEARWFYGNTAQSEKSQFRIAFFLPEDINVERNPSEKSSYLYSSLKVTYKGDGTVEKIYDTSQNSTVGTPTWICVSGNGNLSYKNSVIIDLTGIDLSPETYVEEGVIKDKYTITVEVVSKWGNISTTEYTIQIVDFPLGLSDDNLFPNSGDFITASSFNQFISARNTIATFTNNTVTNEVQAGETITYACLASIIDPINKLFNKTKDWNNVKKYVLPRSINIEGNLTDDVPSYNGTLKGVFDHIYPIDDVATSISPTYSLPPNYEEIYNEYFQSDNDYVFRCSNSNHGENIPLDDPYITLNINGGAFGVFSNYYIAVLDKELQADYKYEIDWQTKRSTASFGTEVSSVIGGSYNVTVNYLENQYADGLFIGVIYNSQECLGLRSGYDNTPNPTIHYDVPQMEEGATGFNDRHTTVFQLSESVSPNVRTSGGFFIMAGRNYLTGEAFVKEEGVVSRPASSVMPQDWGKIYGIKIYDSSDVLIMNFVPAIENSHKGMTDTVSGTFYPCNDDSMFTVHNYAFTGIYKATEYNALWSYFNVYRKLQTQTVIPSE